MSVERQENEKTRENESETIHSCVCISSSQFVIHCSSICWHPIEFKMQHIFVNLVTLIMVTWSWSDKKPGSLL